MVRINKGRSLLVFPEDYVVLDLATARVGSNDVAIIEIAGVKYKKGEQVATFQTLVNPGTPIGDFVQRMTGITDGMLEDAPIFRDIVDNLLDFVEDLPILGYNTHFNIIFLYDSIFKVNGYGISNDSVDIQRIAKKVVPEVRPHRLSNLVGYYGMPYDDCQRVMGNCLAVQNCYKYLQNQILAEYGDLESFVSDKIKSNLLEWKN